VKAQALIFLGAPGAGKGTQAREVAKALHIPHISTGDILRESARKGTPLGLQAKARMDHGQLVPDEVVCGLVEERISEPDCSKGFILDGFPRTIAQAEFVGGWMDAAGRGKPLVIDIAVAPEVLMKRLTGRRTCSACGEIYNVFFGPPKADGVCDKDGAKLLQRGDDNEEAIRERMEAYDHQTLPLVDYYKKLGLMHVVDGDRDPDVIAQELTAYLKDV